MDEAIISGRISINAPASRVWEWLTTPALIKQWFFGVDTVTDWKPGSPVTSTGMLRGTPYTSKGTIVKVDAPNTLVYTHWSQFSGRPDRTENYQTVTYKLTGRGGQTELTVAETNFPSEQARALSESSWKMVFGKLKSWWKASLSPAPAG